MRAPNVLDSATKLVDLVENDARSTAPRSPDRLRRSCILRGRTIRANRLQTDSSETSNAVRMVDLLQSDGLRVSSDEMYEALHDELDDLATAVESEPNDSLVICLRRDNVESLIGLVVGQGLDADEEIDAAHDLDECLRVDSAMPVIAHVTIPDGPVDVTSDIGWLTALSSWVGTENSWWAERVRQAVADNWARLATSWDEAMEALVLMRPRPRESREEWSPSMKEYVAGRLDVQPS